MALLRAQSSVTQEENLVLTNVTYAPCVCSLALVRRLLNGIAVCKQEVS
jgi:hypothetical protein